MIMARQAPVRRYKPSTSLGHLARRRRATGEASPTPVDTALGRGEPVRDRCRVRDEEHIAILEHIARYSENGFRLAAIRFDRGRGRPRQAIEGSGPGGAIPFSVILPAALCDDDD
jgi:hypothetical protein